MSKRSSVPTGSVRFGGMQTPSGYLFELTGGHLCLDLANTLDERPTDHPRELLPRYEDLLSWGVQAGALTSAEAAVLRDHASRHRGAASTALGRVVTLREAIFRVFSAVAGRRDIRGDALAVLNRFIPGAFARRRLECRRSRFVWTWGSAEPPDLDRAHWPIVWSAAELLISSDLDRVRQCAGAGCAWLFIDASKNRSRRWCDMSICGNRTKARRHHAKVKNQEAGSEGTEPGP